MNDINSELSLGSISFMNGTTAVSSSRDIIKKVNLNKLCIDIKNFLKKNDSADIPEIMEKFNISADTAIKAIKKLRAEGLIQEVD